MLLRTPVLAILVTGATFALPTPGNAEERHAEFLEQMRQRLYFDTALEFLDELESRPGLSEETRLLIPYQRAITLQEYARTSRNPDERLRRLDEAEKLLAEVARQAAGDERLADANTRRAKILLDKAESEIIRADDPANEELAGTLRQKARDYVKEARRVFTVARGQHERRYESFPKFSTDDSVVAARDNAEYEKINAWLNLALCTFAEARTYPAADAERKRLLNKAAEEFREISSDHRLQIAGMYAQLWEAKCFEEQSDLETAIPLYNKLLEVPEEEGPRDASPAMIALRDQALWFKLGCWNKQGLFQLVRNAANDETGWLKSAGRRVNGFNGLGIRLELARANEQIAREQLRKAEALEPKEARPVRDTANAVLRTALNSGREVARFSTPFQHQAIALVNRIEADLEGDADDPTNFQSAFNKLAAIVTKDIPEANRKLASAEDPAEQLRIKGERDTLLESAEKLARKTTVLGMDPADPAETKPEDVNRAWYYLGYVKFQRSHNWDAAVIGTYLGRTLKIDDSETALRAAFLAVAAMQQEYRSAGRALRSEEFDLMVRAATMLAETWPDDSQTNEARMLLARAFSERNDPVKAAEWYASVTENSPRFLEAQVKAGTAFWDAYLRAPTLAEDDRPDALTLVSWRKGALQNLKAGIGKAERLVPEDAPDDQRIHLVLGKITLADILIDEGREQEAVDLLLDRPHSVLQAITVEFGESRPRTGIRSPAFATEAYKRLLRGYIGLNRSDEARQIMQLLEEVAGDSDLLDLYQGLGRSLKAEIERLQDLEQTERLDEVRASFDGFLAKLYEGRDRLPYNTLMWIAENYYGIGAGIADEAVADDYYVKAAEVYKMIIDKTAADADFAQGTNLNGVRLRLVRCLRRQGEFEDARELVLDLLLGAPKRLDIQFETASVFQDWADSRPEDAEEKYNLALKGGRIVHDGQQLTVMGWGRIAAVYENELLSGRLTGEAGIQQLADAKYNFVACVRGRADVQPSPAEQKKGRNSALFTLRGIGQSLGGVLDQRQKNRFQDLQNAIQDDLGVQPTPIEWARNRESAPPPPPKPPEPPKVVEKPDANETRDATAEVAKTGGGPGTTTIVLLLAVALAIGVGCFFVMARPRQRPRPAYATADESEPVFPTATASAPARRPTGKPARKAAPAAPAEPDPTGGRPMGRKAQPKPGAADPPGEKRRRKRPPAE